MYSMLSDRGAVCPASSSNGRRTTCSRATHLLRACRRTRTKELQTNPKALQAFPTIPKPTCPMNPDEGLAKLFGVPPYLLQCLLSPCSGSVWTWIQMLLWRFPSWHRWQCCLCAPMMHLADTLHVAATVAGEFHTPSPWALRRCWSRIEGPSNPTSSLQSEPQSYVAPRKCRPHLHHSEAGRWENVMTSQIPLGPSTPASMRSQVSL
mmetsp:Transcript_40749/g.93789  ORF Transcript_40749/g.93789 Transcript_40749/m.93789 type:complete len:207 (+) Transcript_40749:2495-3115(+)